MRRRDFITLLGVLSVGAAAILRRNLTSFWRPRFNEHVAQTVTAVIDFDGLLRSRQIGQSPNAPIVPTNDARRRVPGCDHHRVIDMERYGDKLPVPWFGSRLRCERCDHLGANARPNWGQVTAHGQVA
jgi:hypothetical protein